MTFPDDRAKKLAEGQKKRLVVIVGPTASGKSDLALEVAKKFDGEIIAADSRTIYKGMDIGTAKPGGAERAVVQYWGLDLVEPGQKYSAAKFKSYAQEAIADIQARGKLPILVGGTGLYVDAVLFDYSFVGGKSWFYYSFLSNETLRKIITKNHWEMPENSKNRRHLLGTIRRQGQAGKRAQKPRPDAVIVGLMPPDDVLKKRIAKRAEGMFQKGIINESRELFQKYGLKKFSGTAGIIYRITARQMKDEISQDQAIELFKKADWQYARRQRTWFKRNEYIKWFEAPEQALDAVKKVL